MMELIKISENNHYLLDQLLKTAGKSLITFRYYNKRNKEVLKNHLVTYILTIENKPVCYGHLDSEKGIIWLGICVIEGYQGKGLGKIMLGHLINFAQKNNLKQIKLSTDRDNIRLINLCENLGFTKIKTNAEICFYELVF